MFPFLYCGLDMCVYFYLFRRYQWGSRCLFALAHPFFFFFFFLVLGQVHQQWMSIHFTIAETTKLTFEAFAQNNGFAIEGTLTKGDDGE